jgi:hypothetical protein
MRLSGYVILTRVDFSYNVCVFVLPCQVGHFSPRHGAPSDCRWIIITPVMEGCY